MLLAAALSGAAIASDSAQAQEGAAVINARIEGVFSLVPGNPLDLAVPLTRRALARRMAEREASPLPYVDAGVPDPAMASARAPAAPPDVASLPPSSETEEGSAEGDADEDVARLPRPRPDSATAAGAASVEATAPAGPAQTAATGLGSPLDLVAGASVPVPAEMPPVTEPQPLLPQAGEELVLAAAAAPPSGPPQERAGAAAPKALGQAQELIAREGCLPVAELADKDGDFKRNAVLSASGLCFAQTKFKERSRRWIVQTVASGRPGPLWAVMHDDEDIAFDAGLQALVIYGGTLVAVDTGGKRSQDGIDPNRNFSDEEVSCKKLGKAAAPRFTSAFRELIDPAQPIIALHNNSDGSVSKGGLGHVSMTSVPANMRKAPGNDPDGPLAGDRSLVLLAAADPVGEVAEARLDALNGKGINVVLEPVRKDRGDCSLSNYAVLSGHDRYFNVTVDQDEGEKLRKIVDAILVNPAIVAASQ